MVRLVFRGAQQRISVCSLPLLCHVSHARASSTMQPCELHNSMLSHSVSTAVSLRSCACFMRKQRNAGPTRTEIEIFRASSFKFGTNSARCEGGGLLSTTVVLTVARWLLQLPTAAPTLLPKAKWTRAPEKSGKKNSAVLRSRCMGKARATASGIVCTDVATRLA